MEKVPDPGQSTCSEIGGLDPVEEIVSSNHQERKGGKGRGWKVDQGSERHHRSANHPDDSADEKTDVQGEGPGKLDDRELHHDEEQASGQKKPADLASASPGGAIEIGRNPGQEDENRRAEMGDPARHEQGRLGDVAGIHAAVAKEIARMIEGHQQHDQAAKQVDGREAAGPVGRAQAQIRPGDGTTIGR